MIAAERAIVHLNVADFAVAVERALEPRLRERPVLVAPEGSARAAVFDMSEEAYRAGVRKGMALNAARRLCRDAALIPPHPDRYERAMRALVAQARPYSPLIEPADENGHLFVDVTGTGRLFGPPEDLAWRMRKAARANLGFDPIWTVAPNKLVAKVASRLVKPLGELSVEAGGEAEFLDPVPLRHLPGLEDEALRRLREFHLRTVGDVARLTREQLEVILERPAHAKALHAAARGEDASPVLPVDGKRPVVSAAHEFGEDTNDRALIEGALYRLTERLGAELRAQCRAARRVGLVLDYSDGVRIVRSAAPDAASANDLRLFALARQALARAWTRRVRIRHLRLAADRLVFPPAQLELFPEESRQTRREAGLVRALDAIRGKHGAEAVRMGRTWDLQDARRSRIL